MRGHGDAVERAADLATIGLAGRCSDADAARLLRALRDDPDARVRVAALGALVRSARGEHARAGWLDATTDRDAAVRRRAAELAPKLGRHVAVRALVALLHDTDATVAEAAAFALGERRPSTLLAVRELARAAVEHDDPLVREAAVAALGALGDERGLDAVLRACDDRPPIRRRAVLALAAFSGTEVDAALERALHDHDWQVRQAAEDLLGP